MDLHDAAVGELQASALLSTTGEVHHQSPGKPSLRILNALAGILSVLLIVAVAVLALSLYSDGKSSPSPLLTKTQFTVSLRDHPLRRADRKTSSFMLIHFASSSYSKSLVEEMLEVSLERYIPNNAFLVYMSVGKGKLALELPEILDVYPVDAGHKLVTLEANDTRGDVLAHVAQSTDITAWTESLGALGVPSVHFVRDGRVKLGLSGLPDQVRTRALEWVAARRECGYLESVIENNVLNKWGKSIVASGDPSGADLGVVRDLGLDGEGEVVGIGDTGIDVNSCFFYDEDVRVRFVNPMFANVKPVGTPARHRKIVRYMALADDRDDNGHGTHVAGSVAGKHVREASPMSDFNGGAPEAKISFFDIGAGSGGSLSIPVDIKGGYYQWGYEDNARIHSNSWGGGSSSYDYQTRDTDEFIHENPDFLVLFAAGNSGHLGEGSVLSPGQAKNILSVGASVTSTHMFRENYCEGPFRNEATCATMADKYSGQFNEEGVAGFSSMGPTFDGRIKPDVVVPGFSLTSARNEQIEGQCDADISTQMQIMSGTSMATPLLAGNVALLRQFLREGYYPTGAPGNGSTGFTPSAALLKALVISSGKELSGVMDQMLEDEESRIRFAYKFRSVGQIPNHIQGFGRPLLSSILAANLETPNSLLVAGFDASGPQIFEEQSIGGESVFHGYRACIRESSEVKVTLVWTDPAAEGFSAIALVNDLDLFVQKVNSSRYKYGNGKSEPDRRNNVEQVVLSAKAGEAYDIRVIGSNVPLPRQNYSLVVTGSVFASDENGRCDGAHHAFGIVEEGVFVAPKSTTKFIVIGAVVGVLFVALVGVLYWRHRKQRAGRYPLIANAE